MYGVLGLGNTQNRGDGANEMGDYLLSVDLGMNFTPHTLALGERHNCVIGSYPSSNDILKCWGMLCTDEYAIRFDFAHTIFCYFYKGPVSQVLLQHSRLTVFQRPRILKCTC